VVREAALRAAVALIAEHGYAATSMAQVAEAAGISPSGLAHHFPSKRARLAAVLDHRDAEDVLLAGGEGPWAQFHGLVEIAAINAGRRELVALYTTVVGEAVKPEHPGHDWMLRHYDTVRASLVEAVREGQRTGGIDPAAPAGTIARTMIALMDGLQVQWLLDPSLDMAAELRHHVEGLERRWGTGA
jgi:AcrR family transcriptional regulator